MTIDTILLLGLAGSGLFASGLYLAASMRPRASREPGPDAEDMVDDEALFCGWDSFSSGERRRRLVLYQRRVRAKIAEQERAWLRARLYDSTVAEAGAGQGEAR